MGKAKNYAASDHTFVHRIFKNFQPAYIGPMISTKKDPSLLEKRVQSLLKKRPSDS